MKRLADLLQQEDCGTLSTEYVLFVAAAAILLTAGVAVLFRAMSNYFADWAQFFGGGG